MMKYDRHLRFFLPLTLTTKVGGDNKKGKGERIVKGEQHTSKKGEELLRDESNPTFKNSDEGLRKSFQGALQTQPAHPFPSSLGIDKHSERPDLVRIFSFLPPYSVHRM